MKRPNFPKTPFRGSYIELDERFLAMRLNSRLAVQDKEPSDLPSLRFSAGLLVALGCLWALYALLFFSLLVIAGVRALQGRSHPASDARFLLTSTSVIVIASGLTWLCIRAAKALRDARRWGAYVAMGFGVLLLLFTGSFVYDMYHPERQSPDEAFGILIVPFMFAVGLWWCVYLNLPHVRTHLRSSR